MHQTILKWCRWVTNMKPDDKNNLSYFDNVVNLIHLLKNSTKDYYNMRMVLGKCA